MCYPDQVEDGCLPTLSVVEEVSEGVPFDAGLLIFALEHLLLAAIDVALADAIRQALYVHPVAARSEDCGSDVRECHHFFLAGEAGGLEPF